MSSICPTVLARTSEDFHEQLASVADFAERVQIDLADGAFTTRTVGPETAAWPQKLAVDIHLMYKRPFDTLGQLVAKSPQMIILHAEADELHKSFQYIRDHDIRAGLALLQATPVDVIAEYLSYIDHVLVFSGALGSFGGKADLSLLGKVPKIRALRADIEIGWDGGANLENVSQLSRGGIDVINVGGAIQKALHPHNAYRALCRQIDN